MGPHLPTRYFLLWLPVNLDLGSHLNIGKLGCLTFPVCDLPHILFPGTALKVKVDIGGLFLIFHVCDCHGSMCVIITWHSGIPSCSQDATLVPLSPELIFQAVIRMTLLYLLVALSWCIEILLPSALYPRALTCVELGGAPYLLTSAEFC